MYDYIMTIYLPITSHTSLHELKKILGILFYQLLSYIVHVNWNTRTADMNKVFRILYLAVCD